MPIRGECNHHVIQSITVTDTMTLLKLPDITGRTALAVRPDVVNAKYHVITNATYNRTPYRRSSNTSRIVKFVRYYAVIIARCGKRCMQTRWKSVLAALTKTSKFSFHINGSAEKDERKWSVSS